MSFFHLCYLVFLLTTVESKERTFKNVTLQTDSETIATIVEDDNLKKYLPDYPIERVVVRGRIPILNEDSFAGISNVKHFHFYKNEIEEIRPGAFRNLQVEFLEIAQTNLGVIRRGAFSDLSAKVLVMTDNPNLGAIEEGALDNPNIEMLVFSGNPLKTFSKDVFRGLPKLHSLLLKNAQIERVDKDVFAGLKIRALDLSGNSISMIPPDVVLSLKNLERVFFESNRLTTISGGVFTNHPTLQEVSLDLNQISLVASDAFNNMPRLRNVSFALNNLTRLDPEWFTNCPNINQVNYVRNSIEELPKDAFKSFRNDHPKAIRMFENKIRTIHASAFKGLKTIDLLVLSDNLIEKWDEKLLEDAESVKKLDLFTNKIVCPEGNFEKVFKAEFTYLGANPLDSKCLEKIEEWNRRVKGHFVCTKLSCSVDA